MPNMLAPFDPSRDFIAKTGFRAAGLLYQRRDSFKKDTVNERVLRQLYEARKIGYSDEPRDRGPKDKSHKRMGHLLASFAASVLAHRRWDKQGADEALAPAEPGGAGGPDKQPAPPNTNEKAEAAPDTSTAGPADSEAAAAPVGDAATAAAAERQSKIDKLMIDHSHKQLVEMAKDLKGVTAKTPKATLAAALVDAGTAA